jgi:putative transposase
MCSVLGVARSGYYKWRPQTPSKRQLEDNNLKPIIAEIHRESRGIYGAPRVLAELKKGLKIPCSKKRVARLMRELGIRGVSKKRTRGCTRRNPKRESFPDLVSREFSAVAPNRLWVADITQHATVQGWLYIAVIIDVFSRMVVGWSMAPRATIELVLGALNMAIRHRQPCVGATHPSDHGSQYTSLRYTKRLKEAGVTGSMGSVGDAYDNAAAESFNSSLQVELLDRRAWANQQELATAVFEYIEVFYNRKRRHSSLEYMTPLEYEHNYAQKRLVAND